MEEISEILAKLPVEILTLDSFPNIGEISETGDTLKKNAFIFVLKKFYHLKSTLRYSISLWIILRGFFWKNADMKW